jgi:hypothetical protein
MPVQEGDQLWERVALQEECTCVAVVRKRAKGSGIYLATENGLKIDDLPAGLWDTIQPHWIKVGLVPGQGQSYGGEWRRTANSPSQ